jgi:hypothetical protein
MIRATRPSPQELKIASYRREIREARPTVSFRDKGAFVLTTFAGGKPGVAA